MKKLSEAFNVKIPILYAYCLHCHSTYIDDFPVVASKLCPNCNDGRVLISNLSLEELRSYTNEGE